VIFTLPTPPKIAVFSPHFTVIAIRLNLSFSI